MDTILVGVDGSQAAGVWETPSLGRQETLTAPGLFASLIAQTEDIVTEAVERVKELAPHLPCEGVMLEGRPQAVLLEEARGAVLVVVGRRGQGALASLLLGSVSRHVADHAPCPVVVVPPPTT